MDKENLKHIAVSILIGATIAFLSSLFQSLLDFLRSLHQTSPAELTAMVWYLAKQRP